MIRFWKNTFAVATLIAVAGLWALAYWALTLGEYDAPEWMMFLGRLHPVVLHLPIGLMILACLVELGAFFPRSFQMQFPRSTALYGLIVLSANLAVLHGLLLFVSGGYEESELARRHLVGGCLFATIVSAVFLLKLLLPILGHSKLLALPLSLLGMGVMAVSSHDGASLTHGEKYLSQYAPEFLKPFLDPDYEAPTEPTRIEGEGQTESETRLDPLLDGNIYEVAVQPIFDRTCVECHKASKKKGKLRMDSYEELVKGGAGGEIFTAGNVEKTYFLERIHLPLDDEEHMPPEGKKQTTPEEIAVLTWWIEIGAPPIGSLKSYEPAPALLETIKSLPR